MRRVLSLPARTLRIALVAAGLAAAGVSATAQTTGFTGVFDFTGWTFSSGGAASSGSIDGLTLTLVGSQNADDVSTATWFSLELPANYRISFDWTYTTNDPGGPTWDPGGYETSVAVHQLSDSGGAWTQSGTVANAFADAGTFKFYVSDDNYSNLSGDGYGTLTITNFIFTEAAPDDTGADEGGGGGGGGGGQQGTADIAWTGGGGTTAWETPANWNTTATPTATDNATIDNDGTVVVSAPDAASAWLTLGSTGAGSLTVQDGGTGASTSVNVNAGSSFTVTGAGSSWTVDGPLGVQGNNDPETPTSVTVSNGGSLTTSYAYADYGGTITVTGAGSTWTNSGDLTLYTASLLIDDHATVTTGSTVMANFYSDNIASAAVKNGAQWTADYLAVGGGGWATLSVESGAQVTAADGLTVGSGSAETTSTVTVTGAGSSLTTGDLSVGYTYNGALVIENGATVTSTSAMIGTPGVYNFDTNDIYPGNGVATVSGGSTWNAGALSVGGFGTGTLTVSGGGVVDATSGDLASGSSGGAGVIQANVTVTGAGSQLNFSGSVDAGNYYDSSTYNVATVHITAGGTLAITNNLNFTNGTLTIDAGGSVTGKYGNVGYDGGTATATVDGSGSTWTMTNGLAVGVTGNGSLTIENGGQVTDTSSNLGYYTGGHGSVTVTGAGSVWFTKGMRLGIGDATEGDLTIENGGVVHNAGSSIGMANDANAVATLTITGAGSLLTGGLPTDVVPKTTGLQVGNFGTATLLVSAGGQINGSSGSIGSAFGGNGTATITGAGSSWNMTSSFSMDSTSSLTIADGATMTSGGSLIASTTTGTSTITIGGTGSSWADSAGVVIGDGGTGVLNVNAGATVSTGLYLRLGQYAGSNGTITQTGGIVDVGTYLDFDKGTVQYSLQGGTLKVGDNGSNGIIVTTPNTYTFDLAGGTLQAKGSSLTSSAKATLHAGTTSTLATPDSASQTITWSGAISGTGSLTKTGPGLLVLSAASTGNTYSGATTIAGGTLRISSANGLSASTNLQFNGGVLEFGTTPVALTAGTGGRQVQWLGDGGFSAFGAARTVNYNGGAGVTWGTSGFVGDGHKFLLSGANSNNTVTFSNAIDLGGATRTIEVADGSASVDAVLGGALTNGGLVKSGAGTLSLTGTNTYAGGTTITGGSVQIDSDARLGTGTLALDGGGIRFGAAFSDLRAFTIGNGGASFDTNGFNLTFANALGSTGNGGITKLGAGTLTLTAANTYAGATTIAAGTLALGGAGTLGSTTAALNVTGGTLDLGGKSVTTGAVTLSGGGAIANGTLTGAAYAVQSGAIGAGLQGANVALAKTGSGSVTLSGPNTYTGPTTISAGTLQFAGRSALYNGSSANWTNSNLVVASGATAAFNVGGTGEFTAADLDTLKSLGSATGGFQSGSALALDTTNAAGGAFTYAGILADTNSGANVLRLTKLGAGTLTLTGDNTYTGITTVAAGTLVLSGDNHAATGGLTVAGGTLRATSVNALGSGAVTIAGGTLQLAGDTSLVFGQSISVPSDSTISLDRLTAGAGVTYSLNLPTLGNGVPATNETITIAKGANVTSGTAGLTLGNLSLTSDVVLQSDAGTQLTIGSVAGTDTFLYVNGSGNTTITGSIATTTGQVSVSGNGTLTLSGDNSFNGGSASGFGTFITAGKLRATTSANALGLGKLELSGGTLELANDTGLNFGRNTTMIGSAAFTSDVLTNGAAGVTHTLGTLSIGNQTLTLNKGANVGGGTAGLTFGSVTLSASGAIFAPAAGTLLTLGGVSGNARSFTVNGAGDASITGAIATTTGAVTKNGAGTLTLSGANTYTGTTTISGGTLEFAKQTSLYNNNGANWTAAKLVVNAGTTAAFNVGGTGEFTSANLDTLKALGTSTGGFKNGSFLGLDTTNAAGGIFTYNSDIANPNSGANALGLVKLGTGTLVLGGTNTYSGDTFVNAGTLKLGVASALSPNTTLRVAGGATFDPNGFSQTLAGLGGTGMIDVGSGGLTLQPSGTNTYDGALSGSGGLTLHGAGTLVLNNSGNTFSGPVNVTQGTLRLGAAGALPSGLGVAVGSGATLDLNGHDASLTGLTGTGNVTLGGGTLGIGSSGNGTFDGNISGNGALTKSGAGILTLSATNGYTGATMISGGTLVVNGSIAGSSLTTVGSGGTLGGSGSVGALTIGSGGTLAPGNSPGTLNAGDTIFSPGGNFDFQINAAIGDAGTNWDLLAITGTLDLTGLSAAHPFTLSIASLLPDDSPGSLADFNPAHSYSWFFVQTSAGVGGFSADEFSINTSSFQNATSGTWSVTSDGFNLALNYQYSAVPEPAACAALAALAALAVAITRRRRAAG
ncbi:MAG TPA: autotransporter-associated beta strand repeat-containing protein [Opitutus sp.]|nr:autotransporter-associated beta strand repeat-containing protein [Opitutus sp.]